MVGRRGKLFLPFSAVKLEREYLGFPNSFASDGHQMRNNTGKTLLLKYSAAVNLRASWITTKQFLCVNILEMHLDS